MGLSLNIILQLVFVLVINHDSFLDKDLPDPETIWDWRETQGHHSANMLMATRTSLVRAVCSGDQSLITSTTHLNLYMLIKDYSDRDYGIPIGVMLCTMVLFMWTLVVGQECRDVASFVSALMQLPLSNQGSQLLMSSEGIEFVSCSHCRRVFILSLCVIRLAIAAILLISGCMWQAQTLSIQDLVLNAAALAMVMDSDELWTS